MCVCVFVGDRTIGLVFVTVVGLEFLISFCLGNRIRLEFGYLVPIRE